MGLEIYDFDKIKSLRIKIDNIYNKKSGGRAAVLGDCVCHFSEKDIGFSSCDRRATIDQVASCLGFKEVDTFDIFGSPDVRLDLHEDIPEKHVMRYDWVIDAGTLFCCFDPFSAWKSSLNLLKDNGIIFHLSGLSGYIGRSYFSFHPNLFVDAYKGNNFDIIELGSRVKPRHITFFERLKNKVKRNLGIQQNLSWVTIDQDAPYVAGYGREGLLFQKEPNPSEPNNLPNNSLIMCVAKKPLHADFLRVCPEYYKKKSRKIGPENQ